jgi:hypothetical protein
MFTHFPKSFPCSIIAVCPFAQGLSPKSFPKFSCSRTFLAQTSRALHIVCCWHRPRLLSAMVVVTEYLWLHEGRPPANIYLLKDGDQQLVSFNRCKWHGEWIIDSIHDILHVSFHCYAEEGKEKYHSFKMVDAHKFCSTLPCSPVVMKFEQEWITDTRTGKLEPTFFPDEDAIVTV